MLPWFVSYQTATAVFDTPNKCHGVYHTTMASWSELHQDSLLVRIESQLGAVGAKLLCCALV